MADSLGVEKWFEAARVAAGLRKARFRADKLRFGTR